jgi:hypothetical protein
MLGGSQIRSTTPDVVITHLSFPTAAAITWIYADADG